MNTFKHFTSLFFVSQLASHLMFKMSIFGPH